MTAPLAILDYAGPTPPPSRSLIVKCWRGAVFVVLATLVTVIVIVRTALLAAGVICVVAGTILLFIGGHRSAAQTLRRWRERSADMMRLWAGDLIRPLRRTPATR